MGQFRSEFTRSGRADGSSTNIPQYRAVKRSGTSDWYVIADTAGEKIDGIVQTKVTDAEQSITVVWGNVSKCIAGGALSINDPVTTDATGRAVEAVGTYTTNMTGATNNDLIFTTKDAYRGQPVSIALIDPGGTTATLAVEVYGSEIRVSLGRASSAINTTAAALKTAIEAHTLANAMISVANKASNDGTGLVEALVNTPLAGGENIFGYAQEAATAAGSEIDVLLEVK